jgi:hypothetical protein
MDPLNVSARFAAFHWWMHRYGKHPGAREKAALFARIKWPAFIPMAHEGLGKLLIRIAKPQARRRQLALQNA